ncbi:hypothetical protein [Stygiolobus caldivivus]|uniref:Uncharacterized protein n=1 Tax=Stygiolobus caldivivus TaxID=2824673 RepID=A0A8D5U3T6_9CREN|nr:hypothetical protein [Stygiolobus caldivivus]BCU68905.1 hypothetical protein KN1_02020 [Stygiolobus caldivivus]
MKDNKKLVSILMLSLIFLCTPITLAQVSPQVKLMATKTIDSPYVLVCSVTGYDHGIIVPLEYVNFSFSSGQLRYYSTLYIYFFNATTSVLLYESALNGIAKVIPFIRDGDLYIVVRTFANSPYISQTHSRSVVYVFSGLKLVSTYTIAGTLLSPNEVPPPSNLSAIQIEKFWLSKVTVHINNYTATAEVCTENVTIELNGVNITLVGLRPMVELQLSEGVLVIAKYIQPILGEARPPLLNFTLFSNNGKVIWTENYSIREPQEDLFNLFSSSQEVNSDLFGLLTRGKVAVVGDQLFLINVTQQGPFFGELRFINATILGVNLSDGLVTTRVDLTNVTPNIGLLNIGGKLYVLAINSSGINVEKYSDGRLTEVSEIPLVIQTKQVVKQDHQVITYPNGTTIRRVVNVTINVTNILTSAFYSYGRYLLIASPSTKGTNVTDIYSRGITYYTLGENVTQFQLTQRNYVLLMNNSNNFTLVFLNSNGTVMGTMDIGGLGSALASSLLPRPYVYVSMVNPYTYYVLKVYYNLTSANTTNTEMPSFKGETQINVYEVEFPQHSVQVTNTITSNKNSNTVPNSTPSNSTPPSTPTSVNTTLLIAVVVIAVVAVAAVLALKRKK